VIIPGIGGNPYRIKDRPAAPVFVGGYSEGFAGSASTRSISLTGLTGGVDTAPSHGDIVVVCYCVGGGANDGIDVTISTAGYTEVADLQQNETFTTNLGVFWKFMGSTPDTTVVVGATGNTSRAGAVSIHVWRGIDPNFPLDVVSTTAGGGNTPVANPPSITPITAEAVVLCCAGAAHGQGTATFSHGSLTEVTSAGGSDTDDATSVIGCNEAWSSGAYDAAAYTFSGAIVDNASWIAVTMALRPGP